MPSWSSYSSKNSPANTDTLMIKDNVEAGNPNKQLSFLNLWNWIMSKTYAFTQGTKTIPAAINELNSGKANASDVGDLTELETTNKSSIVDAINETLENAGVSVTVTGTTLEIS